jgi:hypothetical protein
MFTLPLLVNLPGVVVVALCLVVSLSAEAGFLKFCVTRDAVKKTLHHKKGD